MAGKNCSVDDVDLSTYMCSDRGKLLPLLNEITWSIGFRIFIYTVGLLWCFLGIAIAANAFMCAIEKITSKTKYIKVASNYAKGGVEEIEIRIWNDTVANLTLMALGSSAPEILLSCIEIIFGGFHSGELGPSTIVGSAAFNLLIITAVCVITIPTPDSRRIKSIGVFATTATFCIFAYVWLIIILMVLSPNYVEPWEAIITFLFFPILVILAFVMDKNICCKGKAVEEDSQMELGFREYAFASYKCRLLFLP